MANSRTASASASSPLPPTTGRRNLIVAAGLVCVIAAMGTLVYHAVPLYRLFCQVTGFGGTTQISAGAPGATALPPLEALAIHANCYADNAFRIGHSGTSPPSHFAAMSLSTRSMRLRSAILRWMSAMWASVISCTSPQV